MRQLGIVAVCEFGMLGRCIVCIKCTLQARYRHDKKHFMVYRTTRKEMLAGPPCWSPRSFRALPDKIKIRAMFGNRSEQIQYPQSSTNQ